MSNFISYGGGGKPSVAEGEFELPRPSGVVSVFVINGENIPPRPGFNEFAHVCGVFPPPMPIGVKPVGSGGQA